MVILGFHTVRNAALAISVFDYRRHGGGQPLPDRGLLEAQPLHRHDARSWDRRPASSSRRRRSPRPATTSAKLIMKKYFTEDFDEVCNHALNSGQSWIAAESELLSVDHTNVAKAVLRSWNFPANLVESVHCHHSLNSGTSYPGLVALVNVSDHLSYMLGMGAPASLAAADVDPWALSELNITLEGAMRLGQIPRGDQPVAGDHADHQ
jgi:hypothetical protein